MRCVFGVVMWVALCYGGLQALSAVGTANAKKLGASQQAAQDAGWKLVERYHAWVYVAAGLISIAACSVPSFFAKHAGAFDEEAEWRKIEERSETPGCRK